MQNYGQEYEIGVGVNDYLWSRLVNLEGSGTCVIMFTWTSENGWCWGGSRGEEWRGRYGDWGVSEERGRVGCKGRREG